MPAAEAQRGVPQNTDFTSRRSSVMGTRGMVSCSQPLAAEVRACTPVQQMLADAQWTQQWHACMHACLLAWSACVSKACRGEGMDANAAEACRCMHACMPACLPRGHAFLRHAEGGHGCQCSRSMQMQSGCSSGMQARMIRGHLFVGQIDPPSSACRLACASCSRAVPQQTRL